MFAKFSVLPTAFAALVCAVAPGAADDIALSLVHHKDRIDIPGSAITRVEARATITYFIAGTQERREFPSPHVELCPTAEIREQICRLTRQIIEQPMSIVVDCEVISRPVVREPLCKMPCFHISTNDILEANALAQRIKKGSNRRCAPAS